MSFWGEGQGVKPKTLLLTFLMFRIQYIRVGYSIYFCFISFF